MHDVSLLAAVSRDKKLEACMQPRMALQHHHVLMITASAHLGFLSCLTNMHIWHGAGIVCAGKGTGFAVSDGATISAPAETSFRPFRARQRPGGGWPPL